jgi:hypothetical protein
LSFDGVKGIVIVWMGPDSMGPACHTDAGCQAGRVPKVITGRIAFGLGVEDQLRSVPLGRAQPRRARIARPPALVPRQRRRSRPRRQQSLDAALDAELPFRIRRLDRMEATHAAPSQGSGESR